MEIVSELVCYHLRILYVGIAFSLSPLDTFSRFCLIVLGLLATMELKSRHDLISRIYNMIVPCRDEISFEVYMNDDAMDHVVFALAKKKAAKVLQKEVRDLQRFATLLSPPGGRKWVSEELAVVSESKEVAGDMITEAVLDQVFLLIFIVHLSSLEIDIRVACVYLSWCSSRGCGLIWILMIVYIFLLVYLWWLLPDLFHPCSSE